MLKISKSEHIFLQWKHFLFLAILGLLFNKAADSCDYSRNVICNKKSEKSSTSSTTTKSTTTLAATKPGTTSTTTTTTSTESAAEEEYEEDEEGDTESQEDPKAIKQLITLIKKLGLYEHTITDHHSLQ